ncbi:MAG: 2-oxo acid dehydrogenase subunit E2 [Flavobacterium lindanitolerans]|jgi:2-oxoglutarate dehydrogenase E2 component (dihydrolipoamide succinyltransferase)|uniref:dihydrolipoamide acetyltransferase family protein n=1 Tax=Flavobacterium TaxID=237 RepID=UPI000701D8F6|nr:MULTISPECIES: dihydrolipoamide acetyltransferase family protein [Flavobacterium]MBU7569383.1 2-oxo acid dehydrogenase subunit E2 [Flavobacterium sp.]PZQ79995.1 MAG: 2-oxo acid dehydrogenase subunit E2 [Flavobacterium johnsoniae]KQS47425.1 diapophytoene dehydrogenase [Flavobacterium sp. Leaf359]MBL7869907.1 2-oxo acid dehydrogenase subunit E2 [Flavobacterium lindanitolerans]THD34069.1 MAG: 2-oxo acid dehydrogenase subunit E2 [Flavobacterium johnsoniae]
MAKFELKLPKMGESVAEATITNWLKKVGDPIEADEAVLEIATDKVDSEVPSEVSGVLSEILFNVDDVVKVGQTIAYIEVSGGVAVEAPKEEAPASVAEIEKTVETAQQTVAAPQDFSGSDKFFSPLVKNIAKEEGVTVAELESIQGSGKDGRVTKDDILGYVANRKEPKAVSQQVPAQAPVAQVSSPAPKATAAVPVSVNGGDEIVEMDRMRKLISGYMVASVQTSAHVQSFIEVDVTNIVKWRDKVKNAFEKREGEKLTFTPIFMEAVAKALKDFPGMNISVDGEFIIKRKNINLGMAAALPNGNLIVPVIKNADQLNLVGMAKAVNDLGNRAKAGKLKPDDTQGGTYTVTNVGTFGSVFGTPIINQPQVGILALGAIRKVPAVIETPEGDFIGIRQKMFLSHSYDHRVVDGALGGSFVKRVADYLEAFDVNRDF